MQQIFKGLAIVLGTFVFLVQIYQVPALARVNQSEKVEALTELVAEINHFYLDPRATDFMTTFYTRESYENLREAFIQVQSEKIPNWETELDDMVLTELYQLLRSAVIDLRPLMIRRGEATARDQNLNFRAVPETESQVFHRLSYGTPFEILEEVQGGVVVGNDLVQSDRWFRIRHNGQPGYVHAGYVRDLPVSEERIRLLAEIGRQELWIQAKIEGWRTDYSAETQDELQEILDSAQALKAGNWQFDFSYSELNDILERLSYQHLNLITLSRYNLINEIIQLETEIEANIEGTGNVSVESYTEASWEDMYVAWTAAQAQLSEDWQSLLSDEELESIYDLLRSGLNGLQRLPQQASENDLAEADLADNHSNLDQIITLGLITLVVLAVMLIIVKMIKVIQERKFNE